ncbi:MAG: hypothetical protein U0V73_05995 [Acidimicrobiia bacterium]
MRTSHQTDSLSGPQRAAVVLGNIPDASAGLVRDRLSFSERRLIELAARELSELPREVHREVLDQLGIALSPVPPEFPVVSHHRHESCPFRFTDDLARFELVHLLELEDPLSAAVTLCHLDRSASHPAWEELSTPRRDTIVRSLNAVSTVGIGKTASIAERMENRYLRWPGRGMRARHR